MGSRYVLFLITTVVELMVDCVKANIGPLLAEQQTETRMRISTTKKGERVILDPTITTSRIFMYFYLVINIGALLGSISMVYAEKYVDRYPAALKDSC